FRALRCPAPEGIEGASLPDLWQMAVENTLEALGDVAGILWGAHSRVERLQAHVEPIAQDGRLQPHEWIVTPDGTLLKTDAVDHHLGHDLVGPQDIGWDVAGLEAEWALDAHELRLVEEVLARRTGRRLSPELLGVYRIAYRAFRMGQLWMGADRAGRSSEVGARLGAAAERMRRLLAAA